MGPVGERRLMTTPKRCATIGCGRGATTRITYTYGADPDAVSDDVCTSCADGYGRRVIIDIITRQRLDYVPTAPTGECAAPGANNPACRYNGDDGTCELSRCTYNEGREP